MNMPTCAYETIANRVGGHAQQRPPQIKRTDFLPGGRIGTGPDSLSTDPGPAPAPESAVIIKMTVLLNQKATHSTA